MDRSDAPQVLRDFLVYHETIRGHSKNTVDEYYLDLRTFFRYLKLSRGLVPRTTELEDISISDIDVPFISKVTLAEIYDFLAFLSRDRIKQPNSAEPEFGLTASSRARKIAAIRSFFKYMTVKAKLLDENPVQDLDSPKLPKTLPRYLTLDESQRLLSAVDGSNKERDYCILCIFLNCGLRISELVESKNVTVLFVSHSVEQVKRVCERCIWIEKGNLRMDGPAAEVADAYAHMER